MEPFLVFEVSLDGLSGWTREGFVVTSDETYGPSSSNYYRAFQSSDGTVLDSPASNVVQAT